MRYPLLLSLFALISGIVLGRWLQFGIVEAVWPAIAIGLLGIASQSIWLRRTCAVFAVAFLGTLTEAGHRQEPPPTIDAGVRETVLLAGCVVEPTQLAPNREQFTLELAAGARAHVAHYLEEDSIPFHLRYGQRVEVEARIRRPRVYRNPGAFDYPAYLARQNVFWTAAVARHVSVRRRRFGGRPKFLRAANRHRF